MPANGSALEETALVAATPVELLRLAIAQNADMDKLTKLMDLQERWERNEARKAYQAAMNAFKAEPARILKSKLVSFDTSKGRNEYRYAPLNEVCDAVVAELAKVGISHRWKIEQQNEWIRVTCILTHALGHAEETTLAGTADTSGSKNSIQAIGSTVTYLERYTLLAACGLAAADTDTDGRIPTQASGIPQDRLNALRAKIQGAENLEELKQLFKAAYREADQAKDRAAMTALIATKDARKKILQ